MAYLPPRSSRADWELTAVPRHDGAADPARGDGAGREGVLAVRSVRCATRRERDALRELRAATEQPLRSERLSVAPRAPDRLPRGPVPLGNASAEARRGARGARGDRLPRRPAHPTARRPRGGRGGACAPTATDPPPLI